jgi:hypothetical protein
MALAELPPSPSAPAAVDAHHAALKREPAEQAARAALPGAVALWVASETFHLTHVPALDIALAAVAVGALLHARMARKAHKRADPEKRLKHARQVLTGTVFAGGWLALATWHGPLYGPYCAVTWVWLALALWGLRWLHRHEVVTAAKTWRARKMGALREAHPLGIGGAHLISHEETRLGEVLEFDTTGTGRRATSLAGRDLEERYAERRGLPFGRVHSSAPKPGRLRLRIQLRDPWKHPIPHPLFDDAPEIDLTGPRTITQPLIVGQDPDSGRPLRMTLFDSHGGKTVIMVGKKDAGKTTLISDVCEAVTACDDALLVYINVSKAIEALEWSPACYESAIGPGQSRKAIAILDWLCGIIDGRPLLGRDVATLIPSSEQPGVVLVADEIDALMKIPGASERLQHITSKHRSEALAVLLAGQRGVAQWFGGANVRSQADLACIGRCNQTDANHAAGEADAPNMSAYGEAHSGVWWIGEREAGGRSEIGRAFNLSDLLDVRELAYERRDRPVKLEAGLPQRPSAKVTVTAGGGPAGPPGSYPPVTTPSPAPETPGDLGAYDMEHGSLDSALDPEARALLAKLDGKRAANDRVASENEEMAARLASVPQDQLDRFTSAAWAEEARKTMITDEQKRRLLQLSAGEGVSGRALVDQLGAKRHEVTAWMNRLRLDGLVGPPGKGKGAKFKITAEGEAWLNSHPL